MRVFPAVVALVVFAVACSSDPDPAPSQSSSSGSASSSSGAASSSSSSSSSSGEVDAGLQCAGQKCSDSSPCCNGFTCVFDANDPAQGSICASNCLNGTQCNSGCCTVLIQGTSAVCAPPKYCAGSCQTAGQPCASAACCPNSVCVNSTVTGVSCAARCTSGTQCVSGCCAPLSNTGELVCSPPSFCQ